MVRDGSFDSLIGFTVLGKSSMFGLIRTPPSHDLQTGMTSTCVSGVLLAIGSADKLYRHKKEHLCSTGWRTWNHLYWNVCLE